MALDPAVAAFAAAGIHRTGVAVQVQRIIGQAPATTVLRADIIAKVIDARPDPEETTHVGINYRTPGTLSEHMRTIFIVKADLVAQNFPLPLKKLDRIVLTDLFDTGTSAALILAGGGDLTTVNSADRFRRAIQGVIVVTAAGVA